MKCDEKFWKKALILLALYLIVFGGLLRFGGITQSEFFFYDEGLYLNHGRSLVDLVAAHPTHGIRESVAMLGAFLKTFLASQKFLWYLTAGARVFFAGPDSWYFTRLVSAIVGALTIALLFVFARRYFRDWRVGLLSGVFLAILPSHVFYSRLGLQEALCAFLFLAGTAFYLSSRNFSLKTVWASLLLTAAFWTNYRLIFIPILILFLELYLSLGERQKPAWRKYAWFVLIFFTLIFSVGSLDDGKNIRITFGWMFFQSTMVTERFDWINLLSYPYYLFRLEHLLWGCLFFLNGWLLWQKRFAVAMPFALTGFYMLIYSLAGEKGARYMCVVLPFVAMAAAAATFYVLGWLATGSKRLHQALIAAGLIILCAGLLQKSVLLSRAHSGYSGAVEYLKTLDPGVKFLTSQPLVQNLYVSPKQVAAIPKELIALAGFYRLGYRYVVLDPQAYVDLTKSGRRFDTPLHDHLNFMLRVVPPLKTFAHFQPLILERFVFEHNENLIRSLEFLNQRDPATGTLRIYDLKDCFRIMKDLQLKSENQNSAFWGLEKS